MTFIDFDICHLLEPLEQIAVVGQPEWMVWVGSDLQFCVGCY